MISICVTVVAETGRGKQGCLKMPRVDNSQGIVDWEVEHDGG